MPTTKSAIDPVPLKAGAATYYLANDWNALCEIENEFDQGIWEVVTRFADGATVRLNDFHRLVVSALRDGEGKRPTPEAAAEIVQIAGPEAVTAAGGAHLLQIVQRLGKTTA